MADIKVRECELEDIGTIFRLNSEEMHYEFSYEQTSDKLNALLNSTADKILVAEIDGEAVGYIHACDYDLLYAPHMKNIMGIAIFEKYKRRGAGRALLTAIEEWAAESGAEGVRLCSGEERTRAHEFYKSCGYSCGKKQLNFKKQIESKR